MDHKYMTELRDRHSELKYQLRQVEREMSEIVLNFEGSVKDALIGGIVKLNFPAPPGFHNWLRKDR